MPCHRLPGGGFACTSGRARRCSCGSGLAATRLCDWKTPQGRQATCSKAICVRCRTVPAAEKDLCPDHAAEWAARQARRAAAEGAHP